MRDRGKNIREKETETPDGQRHFPKVTAGVREWWNVSQKDKKKKGDQQRGSERGV